MTRADQILQLSLAMEALERCLEHMHQSHKSGVARGDAIVAVIHAQSKVQSVLTAMVKEEVEAA